MPTSSEYESKSKDSYRLRLVAQLGQVNGLITPKDRQVLEQLARGPQSGLTPKLTATRASIVRLRKAIDHYFRQTRLGRKEPQRLEITTGGEGAAASYHLQLVDNPSMLDAVEHFWDAHCFARPRKEKITILYTEPLFFWNPKARSFIRFLDLNHESTDLEDLKKKVKGHEAKDLVPSFNYQPGGEIGARNRIVERLTQLSTVQCQSMIVQSQPSREIVQRESEWVNMNLIVLGNKRTSRIFKDLQQDCQILVEDQYIESTIKGRKKYIDGEKDGQHTIVYAVLTRKRNMNPEGVVTLIGANHGRAAEKVADLVTGDDLTRKLYEPCGFALNEELPEFFQILFRVRMYHFDIPLEIEPIDWTPRISQAKTRTAKAHPS